MAPGTSLASSSLLTILTCIAPHKATSDREVTPNQYSSSGDTLPPAEPPLTKATALGD